jgi:hypothetical protein
MVTIQSVDAQALFVSKLVAVYQERPKVTSFLRSFFNPVPPTDSLELDVFVQRNGERVAVDVLRGTEGSRVEFSKLTQKKFVPPYWRLYFDQNAMQAYETFFRQVQVSSAQFAALIHSTADHVMELRNQIERAKELQAASIFSNGTLRVNAGTQIDFKRKAGSMVNESVSAPWTTGSTDIFARIQAWCDWMRANGKVQGESFNLLLGSSAKAAFDLNTVVLARQNLYSMRLDSIVPPVRQSTGGVYHGTISAGPYHVNIWTYPEIYEDPNNSNAQTSYLNAKQAVLLPANPNFVMAHALCPQLLNPGEAPQVGDYIISQYTDEKARTREFHVESAGMCIPVAVDQIYTAQVVV